jgi:hypothetical protein
MKIKGQLVDIRFVRPVDVEPADEVMKSYRDIAKWRAYLIERKLRAEAELKWIGEVDYNEERSVLVKRPAGVVES